VLAIVFLLCLVASAYAQESQEGQAPGESGPAEVTENANDSPKEDANAESEPDIKVFKKTRVPPEYRPFRSTNWEYIDLCVLLVLLASGTFLILRHVGTRWLLLQLLIVLAYFGFWRGGCICPIGAVGNVSRALVSPEQVGRVTLLFFLAPLAVALVAGRVFCGSACPIGAVQSVIFRGSRPLKLPGWLDRLLLAVPVLILVGTVWWAARGVCNLACRLDPFVTMFAYGEAAIRRYLSLRGADVFFESGPVMVGASASWAFLCGMLVLSVFFAFPFCRFLCPYGVLLGVFSTFVFRKRVLGANGCAMCGACEKVCPTTAVTLDRDARRVGVNAYRCIHCGFCDSKCPTARKKSASISGKENT
jgi:polyferredoxin